MGAGVSDDGCSERVSCVATLPWPVSKVTPSELPTNLLSPNDKSLWLLLLLLFQPLSEGSVNTMLAVAKNSKSWATVGKGNTT